MYFDEHHNAIRKNYITLAYLLEDMATQYVYSVSSSHNLVQQSILSIKPLLNYVKSDQITVFVTPPAKTNDLKTLRSLDVDVERTDHYSDAMPKTPNSNPRYYADKLNLCKINSDSVVFFDADTLILDDPSQLVTGVDLRARPGHLVGSKEFEYSGSEWEHLCSTQTESYLEWMPNTGVLVFGNESHKQIEQDWANALSIQKQANQQWTEQHALAVAAGDLEVEKMNKKEHVMMWNEELPTDGIVYHLGDLWKDTSKTKSHISQKIADFIK